MSTPPRFQVIQQTAIELNVALLNAQIHVLQHAPGSPFASCHTKYRDLIMELRDKVVRNAAETADFLVNNIFRELLAPDVSTARKQTAIDKFRNAQALRDKYTSTQNILHEMEQLNGLLSANMGLLTQGGDNPQAMMNRVSTIMDGVRSIIDFYMKIGTMSTELKNLIGGGNNPLQKIQEETRWLSTVSIDYKAFRPNI
ncbi:hypothetical protein QCA50_013536 [Cerrena zonata]|uniref:Uncharacterized protein n=1 Tax=Cerrena zonata TaxID=2478898 RepID=A0AAW0FYK9_9APHY